jgi:hypothetical protein
MNPEHYMSTARTLRYNRNGFRCNILHTLAPSDTIILIIILLLFVLLLLIIIIIIIIITGYHLYAGCLQLYIRDKLCF